ncbi:tRNA 4-thiouridine(8) synthase ThiI [Candidatus Woesearchaeota archaeon B3_Woes]|nr:MAG: tRNA 4-thiouridine(8) synthase ThiI [Candidatus Woesearchaeota archaeon B3_Woes]
MIKNKFDSIVIHYDEIGLKGKNRGHFERLLINNIKKKTGKLVKSIKREVGQITLTIDGENYSKLKDILSKIPGIAYFSFAKKASLDFKKLKKEVIDFLKETTFSTFKVDTHRHDKQYKLNSMKINELLGEAIINAYNKKVKLTNPDLILKIEISHKTTYISYESIEGVGGLPTNPNQKVVALLSGGFDSPVASYLMMKRGCQVILVHFQNKNQATSAVENKIIELSKQLSKFQTKTLLYIIPFEKLQKEIIKKTKAETRMVIYRRFMLRIASKIAEANKAKFLVVGDSLSQVASQTIENLNATYHASNKNIFSPLIGLNKREIIDIAKKIETYNISAQPYPDCCTYFLPKHPILKSDINTLKKIESGFDIKTLVENAIKNEEIKKF